MLFRSSTLFRFKGAFYSFDHEEATIDSGDELTLTLTGVPTQGSINGETIPPKAITGEPVKVSADKGVSWTVTENVTDQNGQVTVDFDKAGTYYVSCGNSGENYDHIAPPICVVTVKEEGVDPGRTPDPTPDPTQDTDEQHTAEEEAQKKAEEEAQKKAEEEAQKKAEEERAKAEEAEKKEQNKETHRWNKTKSRISSHVRSAVSNIGKAIQKVSKYVVKAGARVKQAVRAWIRGKK